MAEAMADVPMDTAAAELPPDSPVEGSEESEESDGNGEPSASVAARQDSRLGDNRPFTSRGWAPELPACFTAPIELVRTVSSGLHVDLPEEDSRLGDNRPFTSRGWAPELPACFTAPIELVRTVSSGLHVDSETDLPAWWAPVALVRTVSSGLDTLFRT
eukprot:scaffold91506_cov52-Phaeocystis_antarctica.AAC.1